MRHCMTVIALLFSASGLFAQDPDQFESRIGAVFAEGNLALQDLQSQNDPVRQLIRFMRDAKLPLTSAQERQLNRIIDEQVKAVHAASNPDAIRRINEDYTGRFYGVLTADQRLALRRYRTDEIMLHSGFASLKSMLDSASKPLTKEQETKARSLYDQLHEDVRRLPRERGGEPDRVQLDKAEADALAAVVKLLTPEQRQVLVNSRQNSVNRLPR